MPSILDASRFLNAEGSSHLFSRREIELSKKKRRPITLLTMDYKILTKALANRLQRVLPLIVHTDQTASVKGRTINDNVRLLHDVIYYASYCDIPLAVISVDQLKAFDRVS